MGLELKHLGHRPTFTAEIASSDNAQCVCGKKLLFAHANQNQPIKESILGSQQLDRQFYKLNGS
jgi:hypothetical protein